MKRETVFDEFKEWFADMWPVLFLLLMAGSCFVENCHVTVSINNAPTASAPR